jgi:nicotinate-nucleotide adenylyltransferase
MCAIAFQDLPDTIVSTVEIDQNEPCYTVDTLELLRRQQEQGELPTGPLRLLIGSDQAVNFKTWKNWERILTLAAPAVVLRAPHQRWEWPKLLAEAWDEAWTKRWIDWTLPIDPVDIASTAVRRRVAAGVPIDDLVPPGVAAYIASRALYAGSIENK